MEKKIVLDPGHGGEDPGAVGFGLEEKNINLDIARRVRTKLTNYADVQLTRTSDTFVSLAQRANFSNKFGADLFLSIHVNAGGGTGFEDYIYSKALQETKKIREELHKEMAAFYKAQGFPDRGMKEANFAVLRETKSPAILLENLFIDRSEDAVKLVDPAFREGIAEAIAKGVIRVMDLDAGASQPKNSHWAEKDFDRLKSAGLVFNDHDLNSNITWGEFVSVIARLLDKFTL